MKTEILNPNKETLLSNVLERAKIENIFSLHPKENLLFTIGDGLYFLSKYNDKNAVCGHIAQNHAKLNSGTLFEVTRQDLKEPIREVKGEKPTKEYEGSKK